MKKLLNFEAFLRNPSECAGKGKRPKNVIAATRESPLGKYSGIVIFILFEQRLSNKPILSLIKS